MALNSPEAVFDKVGETRDFFAQVGNKADVHLKAWSAILAGDLIAEIVGALIRAGGSAAWANEVGDNLGRHMRDMRDEIDGVMNQCDAVITKAGQFVDTLSAAALSARNKAAAEPAFKI